MEKDSFLHKKTNITITNTANHSQRVTIDTPKKVNGLSWNLPRSVTLSPGQSKALPFEADLSKAFLKDGIHQGYLTLVSDGKTYHVPYLFMKKDDDYAKISGFELYQDWETTKDLAYRFYLAEDVDRVTVELYRSGTMLNQGRLFTLENPKAGMVKGEADIRLPELAGPYVVVVTVEKDHKKTSYPFPVRFKSEP
ncbi:hypothetical protein MUN89_05230 [Halobacillus salinarum]|uniref:Uncharacterized protein n=1 Tax=Halobacillus salinarum TaxID=2932257 RepID=A0ABY4ELN0_9BACI|nr:hypothetical protein [Halobacillus salinarum]UOQ45351.1 hypothetical protein MUN89_05230 [Halobacillus salinarum]